MMHRLICVLLAILVPMVGNAKTIKLCPVEVICHSNKVNSCQPVNDQAFWGIDPSPSATVVNSKHYFLIGAGRDKSLTPGTCTYMNFDKGKSNTTIVLASHKNLKPMQNKNTQWSLQGYNWTCPKTMRYKKIKPTLCAFQQVNSKQQTQAN